MRRIVIALVLIPALSVVGAKKKSNRSFPLLQEATINKIIEISSRSIARRYDLNPDQAAIGREMLETNAWNFINTHFDELLEVMPQMYAMRSKALSGSDPSAQEVQDFAGKMYPLIVEAKELIIFENVKFHECLDEKQKVKHNKDMEKMKKDFDKIEGKFKRWKEGGYEPGEFLNRRGKKRQQTGKKAKQSAKKLEPTSFGFWEMYVKTFIEAFQLDKGQITLAYSVLNDIKTKANAYRQDHARAYVEVNKNIEQVSSAATQPDKKKIEDYKKKLTELDKPLLDMFEELKKRLMDIPTDKQRKSAVELLGEGSRQ